MSYLVLVRHGVSEWNARGIWTGWTDIALSEDGRKEAHRTSKHIQDIEFHISFTSDQIRAKETLDIILKNLNKTDIPIFEHMALRERSYGDYTGKNKWQVKAELGEEEFLKLRRAWDYPVPNGESLKKVYERVIVYYEKEIQPHIKKGKNILISASNNSLRALVKNLENIPNHKISELEIRTGEAYVYQFDKKGEIKSKEIRAKNEKAV